jgi:hypothetical protein
MLRRGFVALAIAVLACGLWAQDGPRPIVCYFIVEEGASAEANALMQRYMGVEPEILHSYAPTRFELAKGAYSFKAEGEFGYEAEGVLEVARYGNVVLKSVKAALRAPAPPAAYKTQVVALKVADLAAKKGKVQPAEAAIEAAARKLKLKRGLAWIVNMEFKAPGTLQATVGFAK